MSGTVQLAPAKSPTDSSNVGLADTVPGVGKPPRPLSATAEPVTAAEVEALYGKDPSKVLRSPRDDWHAQVYRADGGKGGVPQAFRVGDQIAVHPDFKGPATPMPHYAGEDDTPALPGGASGMGTSSAPSNPRPGTATVGTIPPPAKQPRVAKRPDNWHNAKAVSTSEVEEAFEKDPSKVIRSPSDEWHEEMYDLDRGSGNSYPRTYKVGDLYVVSPSYPGKATRLPDHQANELALKTISLPGPEHDRKIKRDLGKVTATHDVTEHGVTKRTETSGGLSVGDGNIVKVGGDRSKTAITGKNQSTGRTTGGDVGLTTDATLNVGVKSTKETVTGTDAEGNPIKTSTQTGGSVIISESGVAANAARTHTSATGTKTSTTASGTADLRGNYSAKVGAGVEDAKGRGASVHAGASHDVTAGEPQEISPGVWEVRYVITDATSAGGGVSASKAGFGVGASASVSSAGLRTGARRFTSEKAALDFKKNAARHVRADSALPITTVEGALAIPEGEARGIGASTGASASVSATAGATMSRTSSTSSSNEISVRRLKDALVQVTTTVSGSQGAAWGISGLGLTNEKGGSTSSLFELTYDFDLAKKDAQAAFERLCQLQIPPPFEPSTIYRRKAEEEYDKYSLLGGTASWSGATWEDRKQTKDGTKEQYGGKRSHDQTPGWFLKNVLGEDTTSSSAQIVRGQENDKDSGARAELSVSGDSGEANRKAFAEIFGTAGTTGSAKASGNWTLSAPVPREAIRSLEKVHPELLAAKTLDDKMRVYSQLVKKHGAAMLGGQVGMSNEKWDLALKGDPNFPGEEGRQRLNDLVKKLRADLTGNQKNAPGIIQQVDEEIKGLRLRRFHVADKKRYTDLPARLRNQQLGVIDRHIKDLTQLRSNAQAVAMRLSGTAKGATADKLRDQLAASIAELEEQIGQLRKQIYSESKAVFSVADSKGNIAIMTIQEYQHLNDVDTSDLESVRESREDFRSAHDTAHTLVKVFLERAKSADGRAAELDPKIALFRDAWTDATTDNQRLSSLGLLKGALSERVARMRECVEAIQGAAAAVAPIASRRAMSRNPAFWAKYAPVP